MRVCFKKKSLLPWVQKFLHTALIVSFTFSPRFSVSASLTVSYCAIPCGKLPADWKHIFFMWGICWEPYFAIVQGGREKLSKALVCMCVCVCVCYCYSTVHSFHECVTSPAHPSSLSLLCKFVPVSQSVHCADKDPHPRVTTYRTGMLSEITQNKHLEHVVYCLSAL